MQIWPRYDGPPILEVDEVGDPSAALIRQRRRLVNTLTKLDESQWEAPSRCDAWTVRDVIAHLVGTDEYWALSFSSALRGEPTRFLTGFDPVATPASMVNRTRAQTPREVLASFKTNVENLGEIVDGLDAGQWSMPAEAPPGHVELRVAALHALWDAWVHERDVMIPLGLPVDEEADELELILRYAVGLGASFYAMAGSAQTGSFVVQATDPSLRLELHAGSTVRVTDAAGSGDAALTGRAADLIEALSYRCPLEHALADDEAWMLRGLGEVFEKV